MTFGEGPLRFPPLVEAAETLFVPVAIRNNVEGYEREVLERYEEPTWNNPVVRFLDGRGADVIPRKDRVWETGGVVARMVAALEAAERPVPQWLRVVAEETAAGRPAGAGPPDPLDDLGRSPLRFVPLTPLQARRVDGALRRGEDPSPLLSPRQAELAERVRRAQDEGADVLAGLARPTELGDLAAYAEELRERLAR